VSKNLNVTKAETLNLKELVAYQKGAVVSRTLVDQATGTVTLFAFDEKQGLSEHTAPYDALVIIVEGERTSQSPASRFI
jgi:quercetin dioxygenase-like cupin family protein